MRLVIRDLVVTDKDDILLNNAAYSFLQGKAYRINAPERIKKAFFDCISYEGRYESGRIAAAETACLRLWWHILMRIRCSRSF